MSRVGMEISKYANDTNAEMSYRDALVGSPSKDSELDDMEVSVKPWHDLADGVIPDHKEEDQCDHKEEDQCDHKEEDQCDHKEEDQCDHKEERKKDVKNQRHLDSTHPLLEDLESHALQNSCVVGVNSTEEKTENLRRLSTYLAFEAKRIRERCQAISQRERNNQSWEKRLQSYDQYLTQKAAHSYQNYQRRGQRSYRGTYRGTYRGRSRGRSRGSSRGAPGGREQSGKQLTILKHPQTCKNPSQQSTVPTIVEKEQKKS